MNLEVLEAYKDMALRLYESEALVKNLYNELKILKADNDKKVYIEDICYIGYGTNSVYINSDKKEEVMDYLNKLEKEIINGNK